MSDLLAAELADLDRRLAELPDASHGERDLLAGARRRLIRVRALDAAAAA